jgi:ppGpp synthetase/RelA/SpoT-type nucleotidyltranferase
LRPARRKPPPTNGSILTGVPLSRSQIDRVGARIRDRQRAGLALLEEDLLIVEEFRALYLPTVLVLQRNLPRFLAELTEKLPSELLLRTLESPSESLTVAYRPKTADAIVAKLCRSTTRLSLMQDIAGGRIVVPTLELQSDTVAGFVDGVGDAFGKDPWVKDTTAIGDELGYRAVHVVIELGERPAEIQVRTALQQRWAQTVERLDQALNTDLKHGHGPQEWLTWLGELSDALREQDLGQPVELPLPPSEIP